MRSRAAWPAARALCCGGRPAARSAAAASSSRAGEQQEVFALLDAKSTGAIAGEDLEVALRSLGLDASRSEALGLLKDARVSANAFASIVANEFPPCAGAEGSGAAFGLFAPGATGLITAPDLRVVVNHLGDRLSAEVLDEISRLAEEEARRRRLEPAAWPPHEWGGATGAVLEQALDSTSVAQGVNLPAHMLEEAVAAQVSTYDDRYRRAREKLGEAANPDAQAEAFGKRDATGVEAVHDAMPTEARAFELLASREARRLPHRGRGSELRVLDFGCGDGRYLPLYLRVAGALREALGASLRVVAYDISTEALRAFRSRAEEAGLRRVGGAGSGPDVLALGALSVHFVLGDGAAELGAVRESLLKAGPVFDLVVVGWGTLSSVPRLPGISPAGLLELFAQMGHAIMNVASSTNNHVAFQREFEQRRRAYRAAASPELRAWLQPRIGLATFPGSYYYPLGTGGRQFYYALTAGQEARRLEAAGFSDVGIRICNIINFFDISTRPRAAALDAHLVELLEAGELWRAQLVLCHGVARAAGRPLSAVWSGSCMFDASSRLACLGQVARYFISTGTSGAAEGGPRGR